MELQPTPVFLSRGWGNPISQLPSPLPSSIHLSSFCASPRIAQYGPVKWWTSTLFPTTHKGHPCGCCRCSGYPASAGGHAQGRGEREGVRDMETVKRGQDQLTEGPSDVKELRERVSWKDRRCWSYFEFKIAGKRFLILTKSEGMAWGLIVDIGRKTLSLEKRSKKLQYCKHHLFHCASPKTMPRIEWI